MSERVSDDDGGPSIESTSDGDDGPVDGRVARRQRNIDAVLDVVLEMFAEEAMFPTIEQAAKRSGLSLRSLYRYFADPGELREAAIARSDQVGHLLGQIDELGEGPLDKRIDELVATRLRLYDGMGPVFRATIANAASLPRLRSELDKNRALMRRQFDAQFAPELGALKAGERDAVATAGDLLTQIESVDFLIHSRGLPVDDARAAMVAGLSRLLRCGDEEVRG